MRLIVYYLFIVGTFITGTGTITTTSNGAAINPHLLRVSLKKLSLTM